MIFLLISIVASVAVSVWLKISRSHHLSTEQMVAFNYIVTSLLTIIFLKPDGNSFIAILPNIWLFILLGLLLPSVFVVMGRAVAHSGIVKSDAAQRLSLFLPILAAFTLFGETVSNNRIIGVILAFAAIICLLWKDENRQSQPITDKHTSFLLLGVWMGYGIIDILFKQLSKTGAAFSGSLLITFILAGILMFAYLFIKKTTWHKPSMLGGLLLGILNFVNILFYVKAHQIFRENPTLVFAGMNMGVIVLGTLTGAWFFRERINKINAAGIVLALLAMICLYFWDNLIKIQ